MENKISGHISTIKNDKCLFADVPCLCIGSTEKNGHEYSDKHFFFFPDEVFCMEDGDGEKIFAVPIIPMHTIKPEKVPLPIFMGNFSPHHKGEIIMYGEMNGFTILMKHFIKPKISISYEERMEYEIAGSEED